jgi:hypothetical protein
MACILCAPPPPGTVVPSTCPRTTPAGLLSIPDQPIQGRGDGSLAVGHDVLVAQRHRRGGVPHPLHQLLGGRAGGRRQSRRRVPQVVEAQPVQAELLDRRAPHQPTEIAPLQVGAPPAPEHQPLRTRHGELI